MLRQNLLSAYPKQVRLYFQDVPARIPAPLGQARGHRQPLRLPAEARRLLDVPRLDLRAPGGNHARKPQGQDDGVGQGAKSSSTACNSASAWTTKATEAEVDKNPEGRRSSGRRRHADAVRQRPPHPEYDRLAEPAEHHRFRNRITRRRRRTPARTAAARSSLNLPGMPPGQDSAARFAQEKVGRTNMKFWKLGLPLALSAAACLAFASSPSIDPNSYLDDVKFLASPELRGRATGSPELEKAAAFIAGKYQGVRAEAGRRQELLPGVPGHHQRATGQGNRLSLRRERPHQCNLQLPRRLRAFQLLLPGSLPGAWSSPATASPRPSTTTTTTPAST